MGEEKERLENLAEAFAEFLATEGREYIIFVSLNEKEKFISLRANRVMGLSLIYGLCESLGIPVEELPSLLNSIKCNNFIGLEDVYESSVRKEAKPRKMGK